MDDRPDRTAPQMFDWAAAPARIGSVTLRVRDLARLADFYVGALGLGVIDRSADRAILGAGGRALLELRGDDALAPRRPGSAGLFHTAFLLPTRADLARWLAHAAQTRLPIEGASDHKVSEAVYLSDPEGNGIEIYADKPLAVWRDDGGAIAMRTDPLDAASLIAVADGPWQDAPAATMIGHVHLQVGDAARAERFYGDVLGFAVTARYPGAAFFGAGGYHHQLAANQWRSRGAPARGDGEAGLGRVVMIVDQACADAAAERADRARLAARKADGALYLSDPWGNAFVLARGDPASA